MLLAAVIIGAIATAALVGAPPAHTAEAITDTVARFLESGRPPLLAYRARRHLQASSRGGKLKAQLDAWTTLQSDGTFSFEVLQESGSNMIRQRILHAALLEEQDNYWNAKLAPVGSPRVNRFSARNPIAVPAIATTITGSTCPTS